MRGMHALAVVSALACPGAPASAQPPRDKEGPGTIVLRQDGKQAVYVITSERGIGRASLRPEGGRWPRDVVLRFQYKEGSGFQTLESLTVTAGRFRISWQPSRDESGQHKMGEQKLAFSLADADGKFARDDRPAGYFRGSVQKTKGGIEVRLPANVFTGSREVFLSWVDAFRG